MKRVSFSVLLAAVLCLMGTKAQAYDLAIENDGVTIYYNYINDATELEVTNDGDESYYGNVDIPEEVTYMNRTWKVTRIADSAFNNCYSLTSVTIPNSVTSIGEYAFIYCSSLTSVTIGSGVTNIGHDAFCNCSSLTSVTIPNGVTSIADDAFFGCSSLTSVTIPNSVTSIGEYAFNDCSGLTSVTIGSGVTSIGNGAFFNCNGLTTVTIPNSVTSIGNRAFYGCSGLTSVTIGSGVTSIEAYAFGGCDIPEVISMIEEPFAINEYTFTNNTYINASLYVPTGTIDAYKATEGWKKFLFIEEREGGDNPEPEKCSTPTISFVNGEVVFTCETEGVEFVPTVTCAPQQQLSGNKLKLGSTFTVSVYATKEGCLDSDVATMTLDVSSVGDVNGDGEVNVSDVTALVSIILGQ